MSELRTRETVSSLRPTVPSLASASRETSENCRCRTVQRGRKQRDRRRMSDRLAPHIVPSRWYAQLPPALLTWCACSRSRILWASTHITAAPCSLPQGAPPPWRDQTLPQRGRLQNGLGNMRNIGHHKSSLVQRVTDLLRTRHSFVTSGSPAENS